MPMQDTSLMAWQQLQPKLGRKQEIVYGLLEHATKFSMDMTDYEIARALHWNINTVTPRRGELAKLGLIQKTVRRLNVDTQTLNWAWKTR